MPDITPRLGLRKPLSNEAVTRAAYNENIDIIDQNTAKTSDLTAHLADYVRQPGYAAATGSANTYVMTLSPAPTAYVDGMAVSVKINVDNTGAATINVNSLGAKAIKKANGNDVSAGNLKAGSVYTLRYNGVNFILQGEGGGGTAQPGEVLTGKTFTNDAGDQIGTMQNRGAGGIVTPGTADITKSAGYYSSDIAIQGDADLVTDNIKSGVNIFGVAGKSTIVDTATAVAPDPQHVLTGYEAFANGTKRTGTMPNRGTVNITPSTSNQTITSGYHSGAGVVYGDADLVAGNIKSGVNIFGVNGGVVPKQYATGNALTTHWWNGVTNIKGIQVTGLSFTPTMVIAQWTRTYNFWLIYNSVTTPSLPYNRAYAEGYNGILTASDPVRLWIEPVTNGMNIAIDPTNNSSYSPIEGTNIIVWYAWVA